MSTIDPRSVDGFRTKIAQRLGLLFDESKNDFLADILRQRIGSCGHKSPDAYLQALDGWDARRELGKLAESLTVTETYFFRNADHFRALVEIVMPDRCSARGKAGKLKLLSAGCASGEEPFSMAMTLDRHIPSIGPGDVEIRGIDLNPAMLMRAKAGIYSTWALRDAPAWALERHFNGESGGYRLSEGVRSRVGFEERNLAETNEDLWKKASLDVIFCRNVLMYFVPEIAAKIVSRMHTALAPGGFLFLGHAETLRGLSNAFHLCHTHNTFYYQAMGPPGVGSTKDSLGYRSAIPLSDPQTELIPPGNADDWIQAIQKSSEKIASLETRSRIQSNASSDPAPPYPTPASDLTGALDLLRGERYPEAMEALQKLPQGHAPDPDALLLRAVLLLNMGQRTEAENVCGLLLAADELNAGAHYVMALCRDHAGDPTGAEDHDRTAVYLDASFAMPWLHLGLLSKRRNGKSEALRYLAQTLALLTREDSSRILLFGGGFGRESLIELCRSEIRNLEGKG